MLVDLVIARLCVKVSGQADNLIPNSQIQSMFDEQDSMIQDRSNLKMEVLGGEYPGGLGFLVIN